MMAGFYHENYQDSLLMLMRRRGADAGLVIKVKDEFLLKSVEIYDEWEERMLLIPKTMLKELIQGLWYDSESR